MKIVKWNEEVENTARKHNPKLTAFDVGIERKVYYTVSVLAESAEEAEELGSRFADTLDWLDWEWEAFEKVDASINPFGISDLREGATVLVPDGLEVEGE